MRPSTKRTFSSVRGQGTSGFVFRNQRRTPTPLAPTAPTVNQEALMKARLIHGDVVILDKSEACGLQGFEISAWIAGVCAWLCLQQPTVASALKFGTHRIKGLKGRRHHTYIHIYIYICIFYSTYVYVCTHADFGLGLRTPTSISSAEASDRPGSPLGLRQITGVEGDRRVHRGQGAGLKAYSRASGLADAASNRSVLPEDGHEGIVRALGW